MIHGQQKTERIWRWWLIGIFLGILLLTNCATVRELTRIKKPQLMFLGLYVDIYQGRKLIWNKF